MPKQLSLSRLKASIGNGFIAGTTAAPLNGHNIKKSMKTNIAPVNTLVLVGIAVCMAMLAFTQNAGAAPHPLPPAPAATPAGVPDGGSTVLLLGAALGALGMVRCYLKR